MTALPSPNMKAKPATQKASDAAAKTTTFLARMLTAFFERHNPLSNIAKPAFMKNTRIAVSTTHIVSRATFVSAFMRTVIHRGQRRLYTVRHRDARRMTNTSEQPHPSSSSSSAEPAVVMLSGSKFVIGCAIVAAAVLAAGRAVPMTIGLLGAEVLATILALFVLGSFKYQVHKNALTYGMCLVVVATFCGLRTSAWHVEIASLGWFAWLRLHLLSFRGLDDLVHADTMLFILGLTLFVSVIAQTRLLEGVTYALLRRNRGAVEPTVIAVTAAVAGGSGILGGVSLISLTIRTLVIILMLAATPVPAIRYAIMLCTTVTTI